MRQQDGDATQAAVADKKDVFELQHLHLLSCLETTTVSQSVGHFTLLYSSSWCNQKRVQPSVLSDRTKL